MRASADPLATEFPDRLAELRVLAGLTQPELTELLGVGSGTVALWEDGVHLPHPVHVRAICEALGCTADYLLGLAGSTYVTVHRNGNGRR